MSFKSNTFNSVKSVMILGMLFLGITTSFAQKPEAEIEQFIRDYANAYENITKTRDKESVLKFVSKDLFSTIIKSNVVDNFGLIQSSYGDFDSYLDRLLMSDGVSVNYDIKDILRSKVRGRTGVVVCEIGVQVSSQGEVWNKGTELTTFTLKNFKEGWKILHFTVVSLEEEQNKGTCLTEFFSATSGNYVVKTIVPKGSTYETTLNTFEFSRTQGMNYISLNDETTYSWLREGPVTRMAQGDNPEKTLGTAVDEMEAVLVIVQQDLYAENCTDFKRKR